MVRKGDDMKNYISKNDVVLNKLMVFADAFEKRFSSLWCVCWSEKQGCYHVEPASDCMLNEFSFFMRKEESDWSTLFICDSESAAVSIVETLQKLRPDTKITEPLPLDMPVAKLDVSVRLANRFMVMGIKTIGDMLQYKESDFRSDKFRTQKSFAELRNLVTMIGYSLSA